MALLVVIATTAVGATPAAAHGDHGHAEDYATSGYQQGAQIGHQYVTALTWVLAVVERTILPTNPVGAGVAGATQALGDAGTASGTPSAVGGTLAGTVHGVGTATVPPLFGAIGAMAGMAVDALLQIQFFESFDDQRYEQAIQRLS